MALQVSTSALLAIQRRDLRLPHLTASRAVFASAESDGLGVTAPYGRKLRAQAYEAGWTVRRATATAAVVADSLAIEAKMSDWRRGLRQVSAFRPYAHRAALLVPHGVASRVTKENLDVYRSGLLEEDATSVSWAWPAPRRDIDPAASIWLLELLMRGLENGTAYSASALAKADNAAEYP